MQNAAAVVRAVAHELQDDGGSLSAPMVDHLHDMLARRTDMLVKLLGDLATSNLADRDALAIALQSVSVVDVCDELLAERSLDDTRITLQVPEDTAVVADPLRITQVMDNLITNALRYGGPHILVGAVRDGASVRLSVTDDGDGIPEELAASLFDAYKRGSASPRLGGSGLGLSIVRQLCEAMNGRIEYDRVGGTRFTIVLPAVPQVDRRGLVPDVAPAGHSVAFWTNEDSLTEQLVAYVAHGLANAEGVVVAVTGAHRVLLEDGLRELGIDVDATVESGQYLPLDAEHLHEALEVEQQIDHAEFDRMIGGAARAMSDRWQAFRVYGEIVDLYWRRRDEHLALDLESCWNELRRRVPFPLLCAYELTDGNTSRSVSACHDVVLPA